MDLYQIWFRGSSRERNQLCGILLQSAHGFRFCEGSKFAISHWLGRSPLTQCWRYRAACDEITALAVFPAVEAEMKFHCMASAEITFHFLWVDTAWCTRVSHFPEWGVECSVFPIIANKNKCEWLILAIFSRPLRSALDKWTTFPSVCLSVCLLQLASCDWRWIFSGIRLMFTWPVSEGPRSAVKRVRKYLQCFTGVVI